MVVRQVTALVLILINRQMRLITQAPLINHREEIIRENEVKRLLGIVPKPVDLLM